MENNYWKTAEQMNGRLAMMGFFAAVINYGITGWIIPGFVQIDFTITYQPELVNPTLTELQRWRAYSYFSGVSWRVRPILPKKTLYSYITANSKN